MKNFILSLILVLMGVFCYAQGGLEGVIVEEVDASAVGPSFITYRMFIDLEPGFELQQIYGNTNNPLTISTTTTWFNDPVGAVSGHLINSAFLNSPFDSLFPTLAFDSHVSLGAATQTEWGVLQSDAPSGRLTLGPVNALSTSGTIDLAGNFGSAHTLNSLVVDEDGQFFTLTSNADIAPENRIYIGQFTTDGELSFVLNIQTVATGTADSTLITALENPTLCYPCDPDPEGCTDAIACNYDPIAVIDDGSCILPLDCNDTDLCTTDSFDCNTLLCVNSAIDCNDGNACTTDSCDPVNGCVNTPMDCDDGEECTIDFCIDGVCENLYPPVEAGFGCESAIPVGDGITTSPGIISYCAIPGPNASNACFSGASYASWYIYTASCTGFITVSSSIDLDQPDTRLSIHSDCVSLDCITSDDDGGEGFTSLVTFNAIAGEDYLIEWDDRWDDGEFDFEISCSPYDNGCTDATACNYNVSANNNDASCIYATGCDTCTGETDGSGTVNDNPEVGETCDDGDPNTTNDIIGADCVCSPSPINTCPTDLNGDETTNSDDFSIFLGNFGLYCTPTAPCPTDFDDNDIINSDDFSIFLGNFGLDCD